MENKSTGRASPFAKAPGVFLGTLAVCIALLLSACQNPMHPPGGGTLILAVEGPQTERTILPEINPADFTGFRLDFVPGEACTQGNAPFYTEDWTPGRPVHLAAGIWDLAVTGFSDSVEAARGFLSGINVAPGQTVPDSVKLFPIADEGTGTFAWRISMPDGVSTARIDVFAMPANGDSEPSGYGPFYLRGGPDATLEGRAKMSAGQYRVVLTMTMDGEVSLSTVLRIYANMESLFLQTFSYRHFPLSLNRLLAAWDEGSWDFAREGIAAAHFSGLGILGIGEGNISGAEQMFNAIDGPVPQTMPELKALTDAALVGLGRQAVGDGPHANREAAQAAILALALNTGVADFYWREDGGAVTASFAGYSVEISFARAIPPNGGEPGTDPGSGVELNLTFEQFTDMAPDVAIPAAIGYLALRAGGRVEITVDNRFRNVRWILDGNEIDGNADGTSASLGIAELTRIGTHRLTVEVDVYRGGIYAPYSGVVEIRVTL